MSAARRNFLRGALMSAGALVGSVTLAARAAAAKNESASTVRIIRIEAKKFIYTPNQITIRQGEHVMLELTALDFVHGFQIPDLHVRTDIMPGKITRLPLHFPVAGEMGFLCDNFCGSGHEEMEGSFHVIA